MTGDYFPNDTARNKNKRRRTRRQLDRMLSFPIDALHSATHQPPLAEVRCELNGHASLVHLPLVSPRDAKVFRARLRGRRVTADCQVNWTWNTATLILLHDTHKEERRHNN